MATLSKALILLQNPQDRGSMTLFLKAALLRLQLDRGEDDAVLIVTDREIATAMQYDLITSAVDDESGIVLSIRRRK